MRISAQLNAQHLTLVTAAPSTFRENTGRRSLPICIAIHRDVIDTGQGIIETLDSFATCVVHCLIFVDNAVYCIPPHKHMSV